jgi:transcriptional antiterminator RfaH
MPSHRYVLHAKAHKGKSVHEFLVAKRLTCYYPYLRVEPVNPRARAKRPFFPGYLFVRLDMEEVGQNALRWTEGTHGLVNFGGEPAQVSENLIHEIQRRVKESNASGDAAKPALEPGDRVLIVEWCI